MTQPIPLYLAGVCLDCEAVFSLAVKRCPACTSKDAWPLRKWLERKGAA